MAESDTSTLTIGVPAETLDGENRVGITPAVLANLSKQGIGVVIESGAGVAAGFPDEEYEAKGAKIGSRDDAFGGDVLVQVPLDMLLRREGASKIFRLATVRDTVRSVWLTYKDVRRRRGTALTNGRGPGEA